LNIPKPFEEKPEAFSAPIWGIPVFIEVVPAFAGEAMVGANSLIIKAIVCLEEGLYLTSTSQKPNRITYLI
jgi:hypothetical protein